MKRVAIYARKSVASDKGDSIEIQIEKCKDYIRLMSNSDEEFEFHEYKDEGATGANTQRRHFQRMLSDIRQGNIDTLFFMQLLVAFAELERETIRERIIDNMSALAKTGRWISGEAPIGYKRLRFEVEGTKKKQTMLVVDEDTAPIAKLLFEKYVELGSMSKLETYLLQNYITTQNSKDFNTSSIGKILRNPAYVQADERVKAYYIKHGADFNGEIDEESGFGLVTYGKTEQTLSKKGRKSLTHTKKDKWTVSVGEHKGIISADLWLEAQRIMEVNADKAPRLEKSHTALVSSILRCAECGSPMYVIYRTKNDKGEKTNYYACRMRQKSKNERCSNSNVRADIVDDEIRKEMIKLGVNRELFLGMLKKQIGDAKHDISVNPADIIEKDIEQKEKQKIRLVVRISETDKESMISLYENQIEVLEQEIMTLTADLSAVTAKKSTVYQTENLLKYIDTLLDKWEHLETLELEEQRELVKFLFKSITWNSETGSLRFSYRFDGDGDDGGGGNSSNRNKDEGQEDFSGDDMPLGTNGVDEGSLSHFRIPLSWVVSHNRNTPRAGYDFGNQ